MAVRKTAKQPTPPLSKITGLPVDQKRSRAAKLAAKTRKANLLATTSTKRALRLHHKILAGGAVLAVLLLTVVGIQHQLAAFAASNTATFTGIAGKCLDNKYSVVKDHNPIQLYHCNGTGAQKWTVEGDGSIHSGNNASYCIDIPGRSLTDGINLQLYRCNNTIAQKFRVSSDHIVSILTGFCATSKNAGTLDSTPIVMTRCISSSPSQHWLYSGLVVAMNPTVTSTLPVSASPSQVTVTPASTSTYGIYGKPLDLNPVVFSATAQAQINAASSSDKMLLSKITSNSSFDWITDNYSTTAKVQALVNHANANHAIAQIAMYNIPRRDCGNYSAGGAATAAAYQTWVDQFVAGLGTTKAIVVVEPDGLPLMSCLSSSEITTRFSLIKYAAQKVAAQGSWVYIDAGTDVYQPLPVMTYRLQQAGINYATGFAMNISMFRPNDKLAAYGTALSKNVGGKHFVIDSSRNGMAVADNDYAWCNPTPRGLGNKPTENTGTPLLDAYLWVKGPGASDGGCNGAPGPGEWYQSYALMLARNAVF